MGETARRSVWNRKERLKGATMRVPRVTEKPWENCPEVRIAENVGCFLFVPGNNFTFSGLPQSSAACTWLGEPSAVPSGRNEADGELPGSAYRTPTHRCLLIAVTRLRDRNNEGSSVLIVSASLRFII